jgi:hypothetical protein
LEDAAAVVCVKKRRKKWAHSPLEAPVLCWT